MSYIINCSSPFVSTKLTERGREQLAKGQLNFSYWGLGDSEINYQREELLEDNSGVSSYSATTIVQRPKDDQPNFKSFVTKEDISDGSSPLYTMTNANIRTIKLTVNNEADNRGFFSGSSDNWTTLTSSTYINDVGTISASTLTGGTNLEIGSGVTYNIGDLLLLKITNSTLGTLTPNDNTEPVPSLWYKIQESASTDTIIVDRDLPNMSGDSTSIEYYVYPYGEVYDTFGSGSTTAYWDSNTLEFDSACDISVNDVGVWNMNIPMSETIQGITGPKYEDYTNYGSYNYIGQKEPYFGYNMDLETATAMTAAYCSGSALIDNLSKSIAIIHYTNKTISNFYGEFFHIDTDENKLTKVHLPTLMYHRRYFSGGTENGDTMGMSFVSSGDSHTIENTDIEYYELWEDPTMVGDNPPHIVGKVFPQLKMVIFDDDEIVAAMSYKSNRNWTLPPLELSLQSPSSSIGVLKQNETLYATYMIESSSGLTSSLPCQYYAKIKNTTATERDVQFNIYEIDKLAYMRKIEKAGYDGKGFYGDEFKLVYQIVVDDDERPTSDNWKVIDYTNTGMTNGGTIDPTILENQTPSVNDFILTHSQNTGATSFDITDTLSLPFITDPEILQFGDERFFYGNLETYIGARIYKTLFELSINSSDFKYTNNPTKIKDDGDPTNIRINEVGIYDSSNNLVVIGKMSQPIELVPGSVIMLELGLDF